MTPGPHCLHDCTFPYSVTAAWQPREIFEVRKLSLPFNVGH
jgi:hypothetical protein